MKQLTSLDGVSENLSSSSNISSSRRGNEIVELAGQIFLFYAGEAKEKRCLLAASASASASAIRARRRAKQIWKLESNFLWLVKLQLCVQQTFYLLPLTYFPISTWIGGFCIAQTQKQWPKSRYFMRIKLLLVWINCFLKVTLLPNITLDQTKFIWQALIVATKL